jgi:TonB family protein
MCCVVTVFSLTAADLARAQSCPSGPRVSFAGHNLPLDSLPDPAPLTSVRIYPNLAFANPTSQAYAPDGSGFALVTEQDGKTKGSAGHVAGRSDLGDRRLVSLEQPLVPPEAQERFDFRRTPLPPEKAHKLVILKGTIGEDGVVNDLKVHEGLSPEMDAAALKAFSQWTFKPSMRDGKPVSVDILVGIPSDGPERAPVSTSAPAGEAPSEVVVRHD